MAFCRLYHLDLPFTQDAIVAKQVFFFKGKTQMVSNWWWTGIPDTRGLDLQAEFLVFFE